MLAKSGEEDHGKTVAERGRKGIDRGFAEIKEMSLAAESKLLGDNGYRNAQYGTVGGDERQENSESLVKGRRNFLEHNLDHLYKGGNDQDKCNSLQKFEFERNEQVLVYEISHDS